MKKVKKKKAPQKKIKILTLGDMPLLPSGVGTQSKYVFEALLKSGKFQIVSLGGAVKHKDYSPKTVQPYGEDFKIFPVDGYGDENTIRSVIRSERPDILWFMTDPRFYEWLWNIENEIRSNIPMVYYHVWDNYPTPHFNKPWYESNDVIVSISKLTHEIVNEVTDDSVKKVYIPHAVNQDIFKPLPSETVLEHRRKIFPMFADDDFVFFWNNRNARRKQSGSLIFWFKTFLEKLEEKGYERSSAKLVMHTEPTDPNGQDLAAIISHLNLAENVFISRDKIPTENMSSLYNSVQCTVNISDAEGFGLATLESLACGTPIIINKTGGLQDQIETKDGKMCGIGLEPTSKAIIGSQQVPWIYEDRLSEEVVSDALLKMYVTYFEDLGTYEEWMDNGLEHVNDLFNFSKFEKDWVDLMLDVHKQHGSWPNKKYQPWKLAEIA